MRKKIVLLGSGELGKELVIALQRLGQYVIAIDSYADAPAMQVVQECEVINMLDGSALDALISKHKPDIIVPEIEAIRTEQFFDYEKQNIQVVPSAKAANFTMNRKAIRDLAAQEVKIKTAQYAYATTLEEFRTNVIKIGIPCVIKPLMSSSGKGQSIIRNEQDIDVAFNYAMEGSRGDVKEVIIEEFIPFDYEITLLTVTQQNGDTLYCQPIGHRQEGGDYRESWQPCKMENTVLLEAQNMANKITNALGGSGIWGVEFFVKGNDVYFSELSPRPHDTGMVTLGGTQNLNEFELHARAILGLPIPQIEQWHIGASAVILASQAATDFEIQGIDSVLKEANTDVRIFGKPATRPNRRMGVVLCCDSLDKNVEAVVDKAKKLSEKIEIEYR